MAYDKPWKKIFEYTGMDNHDFDAAPYELTADQIKAACQEFTRTTEREVRILCKQDKRNSRPQIFKEKGLFILPKHNGSYYVLKGEGYVDVPDITTPIVDYHKKLDFELISSEVGDSEMQHVDYAYANSLIRSFVGDDTLVLTIRGRKFSPTFTCKVNNFTLEISSVQTEVDAGYEGKDKIVLIEAKNKKITDTIIRQLYFPYRQWQDRTGKTVYLLFFRRCIVKKEKLYYIWQYEFTNKEDYNSIRLVKSARYRILPKNA